MNSKSTLVGKYIIILSTFTLASIFSSQAQTIVPKLRFIQPKLISGTDGQKHATYKFSNVVDGVDAFIEIKQLKNGAILKNIDDSTLGYYEAWQPTVGGPSSVGTSYIEWEVSFKTSAGADYTFPIMDLSAIDIDGDNVKVREFIDMQGQSSYDVPTAIPSLLSITVNNDDDDHGDDDGDNDDHDGNEDHHDNATKNEKSTKLHILGPVVNRTNIDTVSLDVKVNFHFINKSSITISTGSEVENNGYNGAIASDRFNSLYFKTISNVVSTLGVTYRSFDVYAINTGAVNVSWITENETNNDHFEIEKSFDQTSFKTVGLIFGQEDNTTGVNKYSFNDKAADLRGHQVVYYRLKQIDLDGKFTYSIVKMVRLDETPKAFVQVYPNPYMEKLNLHFLSNEGSKAEVRMINTKGQVVVNSRSEINNGYNNIQLTNLSSQAPGLYIVDVIVNGKVINTAKVIKQ